VDSDSGSLLPPDAQSGSDDTADASPDVTVPVDGTGPCGNGTVDPGEECDGVAVNNATCALLGFTGGTLSCSNSCQFEVSGCTGGSITPTIVASRTTCAAPCAVSFDATTTTDLSNNDYVQAYWSWDFNDPTSPHRGAIGFVVGHVFDQPGTYEVHTRVRDAAGAAGVATTTIVVSPMSGTTYYVAASGNDSNSGTDMLHPMATVGAALMTHAATNNSVLLRRGDTFVMDNIDGNNSLFHFAGPFVFGAYTDPSAPSPNNPVLVDNTNAQFSVAFDITGTDLRFVDLHFQSTQGVFKAFYVTQPFALFERMELEGVGTNMPAGGSNFHLASDNVTLADCDLHDFIAYGVYTEVVSNLSMIGNSLTSFTGGTVTPLHGIRVEGGSSADGMSGTSGQYSTNTYIAENTIQAGSGRIFTATEFHGDNRKMVYVRNRADRTVSIAPTNTALIEHESLGLIEANLLQNPAPANAYTSLTITAQHVVIRNNVLVNPDVGVAVTGAANLPSNWTDQIYVVNNTEYLLPPAGVANNYDTVLVMQGNTTGSLLAQDNVFFTGMTTIGSAVSRGGTFDHNLIFDPNAPGMLSSPGIGTGGVVANPLFLAAPADSEAKISSPTGFALRSGSPAIGSGTPTTAYQDFFGVPRPQTGWDMGALQSLR
jgi:PKD repeat protein